MTVCVGYIFLFLFQSVSFADCSNNDSHWDSMLRILSKVEISEMSISHPVPFLYSNIVSRTYKQVKEKIRMKVLNRIDDGLQMSMNSYFKTRTYLYNYVHHYPSCNNVTYVETSNPEVLEQARENINKTANVDFPVKKVYIVTYHINDTLVHSTKYEVVFAWNENATYVVATSNDERDVFLIAGYFKFCWFSLFDGRIQRFSSRCKQSALYPYHDDEILYWNGGLTLAKPFLLFSTKSSRVNVCGGKILIGHTECKMTSQKMTYLTVFNSTWQSVEINRNVHEKVMAKISHDVQSRISRTFHAVQVFTLTYDDEAQVAFASNDEETYVILNYDLAEISIGVVEYNEPFCASKVFFDSSQSRFVGGTSNIGIPGRHVFLLTTRTCLKQDLYSFGLHHGDKEIKPADNYAEVLPLEKSIPLHMNSAERIHISTNGLISTDYGITNSFNYFSTYPVNLIISPYHLNYDTMLGGSIYHRETRNKDIIDIANADIKLWNKNAVPISHAVVITYFNISVDGSPYQRNTFQIVIAHDGKNDTYLILNYAQLDIYTNAYALVTMKPCFYENIGRKLSDLMRNSNVNVMGKYVFHLTNPSCNPEYLTWFELSKPREIRVIWRGYDYVFVSWDKTTDDSRIKVLRNDEWDKPFTFLCEGITSINIEDLAQEVKYSVEVITENTGNPSLGQIQFYAKDISTLRLDILQDSDTDKNLIIIISTSSSLILIACALMYSHYRRKMKKRPNYLMPQSSAKLDPDKSILEQCNNLSYDTKFEFPRKQLSLVKVLGEGAFGQVWMATAHNMDYFKPREGSKKKTRFSNLIRSTKKTVVAVKTLKGNATEIEYKDLANELKLLIHIGEHRNIVNVLGACTKDDSFLVILEYCANGALLDFMRVNKYDFQKTWHRLDMSEFNLRSLTWIAVQIADGMDFLERKKCVHRDLASRNVLLTDLMIVKIADFGLARDTDGKEYYKKESDGNLPIKWMAPEAITNQKYTSKSDTWSFGVLLWEMYSLGSTPYPGIKNSDVLNYLKSGKRMEKPNDCPDDLYQIMLQCWSTPVDLRPSFIDLRNDIDRVILSHEQNFYGGQSMAQVFKIQPSLKDQTISASPSTAEVVNKNLHETNAYVLQKQKREEIVNDGDAYVILTDKAGEDSKACNDDANAEDVYFEFNNSTQHATVSKDTAERFDMHMD